MKTQISRSTFSPAGRYAGVYQQMGRMITDADWNELSDLVKFQLIDALQDVVGSGSPRKRGMVYPIDPNNFGLRWGHLYVDGVHARVLPNPNIFSPAFDFAQQADFPSAPVLAAGEYRLYADVWERTVTPLEDATLIDPGLKGADTCTRLQTMAQIKACATTISLDDIEHNAAINPALGNIKIDLSVRQGQTVKDPCDPCADELALQDEVGNYLFRVEVHAVEWSNDSPPKITALELKWSSENGAEQYTVAQLPPGFASSQWAYEFYSGPNAAPALNMTSEKHLGHHLFAGFTPQRGILYDGYPSAEPADRPLVRRWDGFVRLEQNSGVWTVASGVDRGRALSNSYGTTDHGFVDLSGPIVLNLNALVLGFDASAPIALAGDYWQAPIRQAIHTAGSILLTGQLPSGIQHHYFVLGRIQVDADGAITSFTPERGDWCKPFDFPSLTDIHARDVCYENGACAMPDVITVQDAIDYLCRERDLRWHNKHLHGTGVVCGLKVQCGCDDADVATEETATRKTVCVTDGYAIDCDGNDLVFESEQTIDVFALIEQLDAALNTQVLDESGNGTLSLYAELDVNGKPQLKIEPYDPKNSKNSWLDGTFWVDFYQCCVKDLVQEIKDELGTLNEKDISAAESANGELVSIQRKKYITLLNLLAQLIFRPHGAYVFLSKKEHVILRDFYLRLRTILQSKTFCGMFEGQDFPEYPFPDTKITTYFGKNHHERLAAHPSGNYVFSYYGADTTLNIYDTATETLIGVETVPSGQGGRVTALTASNDGALLYASVDINGTDSILSRARFAAGVVTWEASAVLCGVKSADLRIDPNNSNTLYLVSYNDGLYVLNLDKIFSAEKIIPSPVVRFNALGSVGYDFGEDYLFATAAAVAVNNPIAYDRIAIVKLSDARANTGAPLTAREVVLHTYAGGSVIGDDVIAVAPKTMDGITRVSVVVNSASSKEVWTYNAPHTAAQGSAIYPDAVIFELHKTELRLAYHLGQKALLIGMGDEFRLQMFEGATQRVERIPVQLMPSDLCINSVDNTVYALNFMSNTISALPADELVNTTSAFNAALAAYRRNILLAFIALFGNLLQNLKDCFCHMLLVKCPTCGTDEKVYLANIDIRDNEVYKICNFGIRKDVKTFPKVEYWLSLVPVLPLIKQGFSKFCCSILPNIFGDLFDRYDTPKYSAMTPITSVTYKQAVRQAKRTDVKMLMREQTQQLNVTARLLGDRTLYTQQKAVIDGIDKQQFRNTPTDEAVQRAQQKQIQVEVKEYHPAEADAVMQRYSSTPQTIPAGSKVTMYEKDGRVLFYTAEPAPTVVAIDDAQLGQLEARKQALADLSQINDQLARAEARKQGVSELIDVQNQLTALAQQKQQAQEDVAALNEQLTALRNERQQTQLDLQSMQRDMSSLSANFKTIQLDVEKMRPVAQIAGVDAKTSKALQSAGILTVSDLAQADSAKITSNALDKEKASLLIQAAQNRLNLLR